MPDIWQTTLPKVLLPGVAIVALLFAAKRRKFSIMVFILASGFDGAGRKKQQKTRVSGENSRV